MTHRIFFKNMFLIFGKSPFPALLICMKHKTEYFISKYFPIGETIYHNDLPYIVSKSRRGPCKSQKGIEYPEGWSFAVERGHYNARQAEEKRIEREILDNAYEAVLSSLDAHARHLRNKSA